MSFSRNLSKFFQRKLAKSLFNKNKKKSVLKDTVYNAASSAQPLMKTPFL